MFEKLAKFDTIKILHICSQVQSIPFNWLNSNKASSPTSKDASIKLKTKKWQLYIWKFISSLSCFYSGFIAIDFYFYYKIYVEQDDIIELVLHSVWVCCFAYISTYHAHFLFQKETVANLVNQILRLNEHLKGILGKEEFDSAWIKTNKFMALFFISGCSGVTCNMLLFLQFPNHRRYFYSFVPASYQTTWLFLFLILYELYFIICQWGGLLMEVFVHFIFIETTSTGLKLLSQNENPELNLKTKVEVYQKLRILSKMYDECCGKFILPAMKVTFGCVIIFSCFALIHLFGKTNVIVTFVLTIFSIVSSTILFVLFQKASGMYNLSIRCLRNFQQSLNAKPYEEVCINKICSPLGVNVGSFYYFKESTPLTFFRIVLESIINLLLGFS